MIRMRGPAEDGVVEIEAAGRLTGDDFDDLIPLLERARAQVRDGRLHAVLSMGEITGMDPAMAWKEPRPDPARRDADARLAVVAEGRPVEWGAKLGRALVRGEMRVFSPAQAAAARAWARG